MSDLILALLNTVKETRPGFDEALEAIRRALDTNVDSAQPRETRGWQSIATAPRENVSLLLFSPQHGVVEGSWEQVDGGGHPENGPPVYWWTSPHVEFIDGPYDAPTHWMPLPPAPSTAPQTRGSRPVDWACPQYPQCSCVTACKDRPTHANYCSLCSGSGLALNGAGEPGECPHCKGNTIEPPRNGRGEQ